MPRFYEEVLRGYEEIRKAVESLDHDEGIRASVKFENKRAVLFITRGVIRGYSVAIYDFESWPDVRKLYFGSFESAEGVLGFVSRYVKGRAYKY